MSLPIAAGLVTETQLLFNARQSCPPNWELLNLMGML